MQVAIDDTHTSTAPGDVEKYDELKLESGEAARFVVPVASATAFYVHELKPVLFTDSGAIQMEVKNRKDKTTYEVPATGWLGRRICTGDVGTDEVPGPMRTKGIDPGSCIVCAAAADGIPELKAELRYALPVIRITTQSKRDPDVIQDPPQVKIYVLPLTWRQYGDFSSNLKGIRELYGWGPEVKVKPNQADIVIECEDAGFKRYKWKTPMRPHWAKDPNTQQIRNPRLREAIWGLWGNEANRPTPEQLEAACGRRTDIIFLQADLEQVLESYARKKSVERGEVRTPTQAAAAQPGSDVAGADDLDAILGGETAPPADAHPGGLDEFAPAAAQPAAVNGNGHAPAAAQPAADDGDLFGLDDTAAAAPAAAAPAQPAPQAAAAPAANPQASAGAAEAASFDDVWDGL